MVDTYFSFLMRLIKMDSKDESYYILCKELDKYAFIPKIQHDENRVTDGLNLRKLFLNSKTDDYYESYESFRDAGGWVNNRDLVAPNIIRMPHYCSILELLIGLAKRMSEIISDKRLDEWFWEILNNWLWNLKTMCDDGYYSNENNGDIEICKRIKILNDRKYRSNGQNGLFPLRRPQSDQREIELWFQMQKYISENISIDDFGNTMQKGK